MATLLLPCDGSSHSLHAVRHTVDAFQRGHVRRVHLLNVQPPFSAYVARHLGRELRADFHRERADEALAAARQVLEAAGVPHHVHMAVGDKARCIADAARHLCCDRVVIGTARRSAFLRALGSSLTARLLEHCPVPVEVIGAPLAAAPAADPAADPAGTPRRFGVPAGAGAGMALR